MARVQGGASHVRLPDLIIVDGGKGQLSSACRELQRLGLHDLPIIGLAKEFEEIYRPGASMPLQLPADSGALRLLQRIRDEAHRFANTYHQLLMKKRIGESILDDCPGREPKPQESAPAQIRFGAAAAQSERRRNCIDRRDRPEVGGGSAPLSWSGTSPLSFSHACPLFFRSRLPAWARRGVVRPGIAAAAKRRRRPLRKRSSRLGKRKNRRALICSISRRRADRSPIATVSPLAQNKLSYNLTIDFPTPLDFSDARALAFAHEKIGARGKVARSIRSKSPMPPSCAIITTAAFFPSRSRRT